MDGPAAGFMLLVLGAVSIIAAIVGDGTKLLGNVEFPPLKSTSLRVLLGIVGAGFMLLGAGYVQPQNGVSGPVVDKTETASPSFIPDTAPAAPPTENPTPARSAVAPTNSVSSFAEEINAVCRHRIPVVIEAYNSVSDVHALAAEQLALWSDELRAIAPPGTDAILLDSLVELVASMSSAEDVMSRGISYDASVYNLHQQKFFDAQAEYRKLVNLEPLPNCQSF